MRTHDVDHVNSAYLHTLKNMYVYLVPIVALYSWHIFFYTRCQCGYPICQGKYMGNFDQLLLALASLCCNGFLGDGDGISSKSAEVARISGRWLRHVLEMPLARWEVALGSKSLIVIWCYMPDILKCPKPLQHIDILYLYESHFIVLPRQTRYCRTSESLHMPTKCSPYPQGLRFSFQCCILEGDFKQLTHGPQVFEVWSWVTCSWPCYASVLRFWCAPGWFCWLWGHWLPVSITSMLGSDASAEISSCSF